MLIMNPTAEEIEEERNQSIPIIYPTKKEKENLEEFERCRKIPGIIEVYSNEWCYRELLRDKYYRKPFWLLRLRCYFFNHSFVEFTWNKQFYRQCKHCGLLDI